MHYSMRIYLYIVINFYFSGMVHNIDAGKDFTVDGLSGFNKKKKKKRRHRWGSEINLIYY